MNMSIRDSRIRATVCINVNWYFSLEPEQFNSYTVPWQRMAQVIPQEGIMNYWRGMACSNKLSPNYGTSTLTHTHDNPILFLIGEQDALMPTKNVTEKILNQFKKSGKKNITKVILATF